MRDDWSLPVSACSRDMITLLLLFLFVFLQAILYIKTLAFHLQHHLLPSSVNADAFKVIQPVGLWVIKYPKTFSSKDLTEGRSKPDRAQKVPWGTGGSESPYWGQLHWQQAQSTHWCMCSCSHPVPAPWCSWQLDVHCRTLWLVWTDETGTWLTSYKINGNISGADVSKKTINGV